MNSKYNIYLVSDFTGETLTSIARSVLSQFPGVEFDEKLWPLVQNKSDANKLLNEINDDRSIVLCTIFDNDLQNYIISSCNSKNILCIPVLEDILSRLSTYLHEKVSLHHNFRLMDDNYYKRIHAIEYTFQHDDGQNAHSIDKADIIILGVSRTSKSPTSIYLGCRGFKTANIPLVKHNINDVFEKVSLLSNSILVVGLHINPEVLVNLRANRVKSMGISSVDLGNNNEYYDYDSVFNEIVEVVSLFKKYGIQMIDVTHSSIEETAAKIIKAYHVKRSKSKD